MTIAIIGAMEPEVAILRGNMTEVTTKQVANFTFYQGLLNGSAIVLVQSGIGKVASALATALVIREYAPRCVINTGSAGGFDQALKVGDIAISSELRYHDVDVTAFGYEYGQVPQMPAAFTAHSALVQAAQQSVSVLENIVCKTGLICTGDSFMCDPARINEARERFPSMLAVEMEGASIAQVCHQMATPFVVIRSLSDIAGKESPTSFEAYLQTASVNSSKLVAELVTNISQLELA